MAFDLSCYDLTFSLLPHRKALRLIADLEIPYVGISVIPWRNLISPDEVIPNPAKAAVAVRQDLRVAGLQVADVFAIWGSYDVCAVNHPDTVVRAQSRERFERLLEFSLELSARAVTILPGIAWPGESRESSLARSADELSWRAEKSSAAGLRLFFEPHLESIAETVTDTLNLVEKAKGVSLALDYSHFICQGVRQEDIERLHSVTGHLHARQAATGMMQASAREGAIDFRRVIQLFIDQGFDGFFGLEYCWDAALDCDRVDTLSETILLRDLFIQQRDGVAPASVPEIGWSPPGPVHD